MPDTTDIEALVAELRRFSESTLVNNAADALEGQQAVVEAARAYRFAHRNPTPSGHRKTEAILALNAALAALDAKPEGEG